MGKCRVLIVDDEPTFLSGLWGLFAGEYALSPAKDAEAALKILESEPIDVVVTDYKMPGMDGLTLLLDVKRRFPHVVRVLMTAYADMDLVVRALNEGEIQRFVAKPYSAHDFGRMLSECRDLARFAAARPGAPRGRRVLVAHDSVACHAVLRMLLAPAYEVLATGNGAEALDIVAGREIDAVILGVKLAMIDGCTIASYLKNYRKLTLPVVFLSTDSAGPFGEYLVGECGADLVLDLNSPDALPALRRFLGEQLP